jgi:hypothetical protein
MRPAITSGLNWTRRDCFLLLLIRFPFCREFPVSDASETRAKRAGAISDIDIMDYFVEC